MLTTIKSVSILLALSFVAITVFSQVNKRRTLTLEDCKQWPGFTTYFDINAQANFAFYTISNEKRDLSVLHLKNLRNGASNAFDGASDPSFNKKGTFFIFRSASGLMHLMNLQTNKMDTLPEVGRFLHCANAKDGYFIYHQRNEQLVIRDLTSGEEQKIIGVTDFWLSPDEKYMLVKKKDTQQGGETLLQFNFLRTVAKPIITAFQIGDIIYEKKGKLFACIISDSLPQNNNQQIAVYEPQASRPVYLLDRRIKGWEKNMTLMGLKGFSSGGKVIECYFQTDEADNGIAGEPLTPDVDVYSSRQEVPYSRQMNSGHGDRSDPALINLQARAITYRKRTFGLWGNNESGINDDIYLIDSFNDSTELVSAITGEFRKIHHSPASSFSISPDEKYILLQSEGELFSYDIAANRQYSLTKALAVPGRDTNFLQKQWQRMFRHLGWIENSTLALVRDHYDIWIIDLAGRQKPRCITNGFGRRQRIVMNFSVLNEEYERTHLIQKRAQQVILTTYNYATGDNDYYSAHLNVTADPKRLTGGGYIYEHADMVGGYLQAAGTNKKVPGKNIYLIWKQSAREFPNLFVTNDFQYFTPVSSFYPEKEVEWLTAEMIHFQGLNGRRIQGVLYKPENFDSTKKYPVIIQFYDKVTVYLNKYARPELLSSANVNIPYFVSQGYLVFTPDVEIFSGEGRYADQALSSILGAAAYLSTKSWTDSSKMATIGHSWGGCLNNYIVTHSTRFAASVSGAGQSDPIGGYGLPTHGGIPNFQIGYDAIPGQLHDRLDLYIKNSAKIHADQVKTPLLLLHNKADNAVLFQHSLGLFYTLNRLKKEVWLLQYDHEGHGLSQERNQLDFTKRLLQFFGHYLKGEQAPSWMLHGIPFSKKGADSGLGYEKR